MPEPMKGSTRRDFLRMLGVGAVASVASQETTWAAGSGAPRIVIIGGGMAGLNAAWQLKKRGLSSTVYEARNRTGGRMFSVKNTLGAGTVVNIGAELVNTDHADMLALLQEFGVAVLDRLAEGDASGIKPTAFLANGVEISEAALARDLKDLAAQIGRDAAKLDRNYDRWAPVFDALTVSDYLDQHAALIPKQYVRDTIEQTIRSEYGVEPCESTAIQLLFILPVVNGKEVELLSYSDERYIIEGGSSALTDAMTNALGSAVKLGKVLKSVETAGSAYSLTFRDGQKVTADIVIVTVPNTVLRDITLNVTLPAKFRNYVAQVGLGYNEKVVASFSSPFWRTNRRFSLDALASGESFTSLWDNSSLPGGTALGVLTFFTGGDGAVRALARSTPSAKAAEFVQALKAYYPEAATTFTGNAVRTNWLNDPFTKGAYASFTPGQLVQFGEFSWYDDPKDPASRTEVRFGNLLFAGEHTDSEYYGFMNGGASSGRLAAESVLRGLGLL